MNDELRTVPSWLLALTDDELVDVVFNPEESPIRKRAAHREHIRREACVECGEGPCQYPGSSCPE